MDGKWDSNPWAVYPKDPNYTGWDGRRDEIWVMMEGGNIKKLNGVLKDDK